MCFEDSNLKVLKIHLKSHSQEEALKPDRTLKAKFSCNQCSYMTKRSGDLQRHKEGRCATVQSYKSDIFVPLFECALCGGNYKGERSLRKHLKKACLSLRSKPSEDCKLLVKDIVKKAVDSRKQLLGTTKVSRKKK